MANGIGKLAGILCAVVIGLAGLPPASEAHPTAEQAARVQMAMMDEMSQSGGMSGQMKGTDSMSGGMRRPEMSGMSGMSGSNRRGAGEMGMGSMGMAPGAGSSMTMPSALPGFAGASHLYHIGATGFFLDYADKLSFAVDQTTALNTIKQRALSEQSAAQRKIDEAEQALWLATAADQPDAAAIEAKLREIEKLRSDMRLAFIRAVGESAKVLTAEQRKMVLGLAPMPGADAKAPTK